VIVVDASALLNALLGTPAGRVVRERIFAAGETLHAPHLLDLEVAQVVRRYAANGDIDAARGHRILVNMSSLAIGRHAHDPLLHRVWALRHNLTAYDAVYVALAEALDAPLITRDARLAASPGHHARIELL
jgi:predicted nucleic acid-binding protein